MLTHFKKNRIMHAVEFETNIDNGIVQIPKEYKELQQAGKARIIILFDDVSKPVFQSKRRPHSDIVGKIQILGDIISSAQEKDWDLPK
jgi:hypothetical protein